LALGAQVSLNTNSFPGFHSNGDCNLCHNEPATAWNASWATESINVNGLADDTVWEEAAGHRMYVPVGSTFGGTEQFIQVTFAQNNTHLFMTLVWGDPGIDGSDMEKYGDADGVSIMWNVNASNFNMYYSGMKTEKPTEMVDTWTWKATVADEDNAFNSTFEGAVYDNAFDDGGWLGDDISNDITAYAKYGYIASHYEEDYFVELARPLVTDDPYDIQFEKTGYYEVMFAIFNGTSGVSHYMSFSHYVWIHNPTDTSVATETVTNIVTSVNEVDTTVTETEKVTETETFTETKTDSIWFGSYTLAALTAFGIGTFIIRRKK
jgi:hypothetical protein